MCLSIQKTKMYSPFMYTTISCQYNNNNSNRTHHDKTFDLSILPHSNAWSQLPLSEVIILILTKVVFLNQGRAIQTFSKSRSRSWKSVRVWMPFMSTVMPSLNATAEINIVRDITNKQRVKKNCQLRRTSSLRSCRFIFEGGKPQHD